MSDSTDKLDVALDKWLNNFAQTILIKGKPDDFTYTKHHLKQALIQWRNDWARAAKRKQLEDLLSLAYDFSDFGDFEARMRKELNHLREDQ